MNKTLEDLYKGRLFPIGNYGLSQEYFEKLKALGEAETELLKQCPQAKELFEKYQEAQYSLASHEHFVYFKYGFKRGAQIMKAMME